MDTITLKRMAFFGYHGDEPEENRLGQRFYIDVTLGLDLSQVAVSDRLEDSVNYVEVYNIVKEVAEGETCRLLERIAGKINERVLSAFVQVQTIETVVHKPGAPVPGILNDVSVRIVKRRNE